MRRNDRGVFLSTDVDKVFLPLVTAFVENGALCYGLGKEEALDLTLAAEEVFMHLCRVAAATMEPVEIRCSSGGYYVKAVFSFRTEAFDMKAFNLTATASIEDDPELEAMGLMLASRVVDRFQLSSEKGERLRLTLIKEKSYPRHEEESRTAPRPIARFSLRPPKPEEMKFISHLARGWYDSRVLWDFFLYPGKLVDMIGAGEYHALAAVGPAGEIGGAILWHWVGQDMVECHGPYIFNQGPESGIAEALMEGCLGAIARTNAVGLINRRPTPELPREDFELLGSLTIASPDGSSMPLQSWFRMIREDTGCTVWVHPELQEFLHREYQRLVLPREIRLVENTGESMPRHSVLFAEFDRFQECVTLRPMWPGSDAEENTVQHVKLLRQEGILNILFAIDLGQAWHADFFPGLLRRGFDPRFVLPYAGEGDVIVFQHREERQ